VKIFNRPLLAGEVAAEYQHGSLAAYWTLDDRQGSTAYDQTSYGRNGTNSNVALDTANPRVGKIDGAYTFDGSSSSVTLPYVNNDQFAVAAWFYRTRTGTVNEPIFSAFDINAQQGYELSFGSWNPGTLNFHLVTQTGGGVKTFESMGASVPSNQWVHLVGTYDKTTGLQSLYINGVLANSWSHPAGNTVVPLTTHSPSIGYSTFNDCHFQGKIDDVKIYTRPLTADEVDRDYQNGAMVAYWKLDETAGGPVLDSRGTSDGVNNGASIAQPGRVRYAYSFDNTDDYVYTPYNMTTDQLTVSAWFYRTNDNTGDPIYSAFHYDGGNSQLDAGYELSFAHWQPSRLCFHLVTQTGGVRTWDYINTSTFFSLNQWHYVVGTYDKTTGLQTLYVDGAWEADNSGSPRTAGSTVVPPESVSPTIGQSSFGSTDFDGKIDDVRIYDQPLTADEVARNYAWGGSFAMMSAAAPAVSAASTTVESVVVNDGSAQRSSVTSLTVTLSDLVAIDAGAFEVLRKGVNGGLVTVAMSSWFHQGDKTIARLTFSGALTEYNSLQDGEYQLTVRGDKIHNLVTGVALDGDGDGQAGGNRLFGTLAADKFFRKFGDADGDRDVDNLDFARFRNAMNKHSTDAAFVSYFDLDGDGDVDNLEFTGFRSRMGTALLA
jgi:hypothetical protein